jgi:pSer/pThr/pTyr-binding forkhead associated (FHA) protein
VRVSASDYARLGGDLPYLERQWATMLARLAERSGRPQRVPEVGAEASADVAVGTVAIAVETLAAPPDLALRVRRGLPLGARVLIGRRTIVVGRDPACDFVVTDPRASRRHLEIASDGATIRFRDLGSSNGTRLNGAPAMEAELGLGDILAIGDSELAIEPGDGDAARGAT